jgi:hypothetical protein
LIWVNAQHGRSTIATKAHLEVSLVNGSRTKDGWPIASILTLGVALLLLLALGAIFIASYVIARSNTRHQATPNS